MKTTEAKEKALLSLILPAHNEESRLPACLEKVKEYVTSVNFQIEVIVVENGSHDRTYEIAQDFAKENSWLSVIQNEAPGKGRAVRTGMLAASGEYRFFADVDFSMPIEEINNFLPPVRSDYDVAIGSREAKGAVRYNEPAFRHFTGRVFNAIVRLMTVRDIQDTQCGFKCFKAAAAEKLFSVQVLDGWAFDAEVLYIAQKNGMHIVEVPVRWYYDGQSKINVIRDSIKMFKDLLQIRRNEKAGLYKFRE